MRNALEHTENVRVARGSVYVGERRDGTKALHFADGGLREREQRAIGQCGQALGADDLANLDARGVLHVRMCASSSSAQSNIVMVVSIPANSVFKF